MLALKLRPGERIVINGAVLHNGAHRHTLYVANRAHVLRERDVLQLEQATTPVSRLYYLIQLMLLDPGLIERHLPDCLGQLRELGRAIRAPEMRAVLARVAEQLAAGDHYKALAALRAVRDYEAALLARHARPAGGPEAS